MSEFVVVLASAAERDIADALVWYRQRNALAADGFRAEVFDAIEHIGDSPLSRPADEDGNRHRVLKRFPYSVFYEVLESTVVILAIAHHRRKPSYWRATQP
ncbi:MAG TPA: type II toxin-antitoxin system RelE/ParE family toxin [Rhizobacter sp.]|nr:type II toxin-antitoxin system RelE/ParE family toxin [Rhizobacter sp.]